MIVTNYKGLACASQFSVVTLHNPFSPWVRKTVARFLSHARWISLRVCLFGQRLFSCHPFVSASWESWDPRFSFFPSSVGIDQKYISPRYDSTECFLFRRVGRKEGRYNGVESSGVLFLLSLTHSERMHKRGGIPAREKGVSSTCEKKNPGRPN